MKVTLAAIGLIAGLMAPWAIFGHLRAEPTRAQFCLTEGWHFDPPVRDQVIGQCMGKL